MPLYIYDSDDFERIETEVKSNGRISAGRKNIGKKVIVLIKKERSE